MNKNEVQSLRAKFFFILFYCWTNIAQKGVGSNSILCIKCSRQVHKKCSGIGKCCSKVEDFMCRKRTVFIGNAEDGGNVLNSGGGVREAVTS